MFFTLASYLQGYVSEVMKQYSCPPHRKIVAEYEKTVAQMIGELVPPSGHRLLWRLELYIYVMTPLKVRIDSGMLKIA